MAPASDRSGVADTDGSIDWVVLTRGDRPTALESALVSLRQIESTGMIVVVVNGATDVAPIHTKVAGVVHVESEVNVGVPGGRDLGLRSTNARLVGFLDDDARVLSIHSVDAIVERFDTDPTLAAVGLRIVDENDTTARRHNPRRGDVDVDRSGPAATFLGGASILRRSAYIEVRGYWADLFYGHEELDLAWRMVEAGYRIEYDAEVRVFHPRSEIGRHADGWWRTGRNRVLIARRNLPWVMCVAHVVSWLGLGIIRAPDWTCRRQYVVGWFGGWRAPIDRRPMSWSTIGRLGRLGRLPIV